MKLRQLTEADVEFKLTVEPEDMAIRGNVCASSDDEYDTEQENRIIDELNSGNVWAWCWVKVTATWEDFEGFDTLGGCSYENETDFIIGPYYEDMKAEALADLNRNVDSTALLLHTLEHLADR